MSQNNSAMSTQGIDALEKAYAWLEKIYPEAIWPGRGQMVGDTQPDGAEARDARESCKEALSALRGKQEVQGIGPYEAVKKPGRMFTWYVDHPGGESGFFSRDASDEFANQLNAAYLAGKQEHTDTAWISVAERLPDFKDGWSGTGYLVHGTVTPSETFPDGLWQDVREIHWSEVNGERYHNWNPIRIGAMTITHWMPLPAPPQTPVEP